MLTSQSGILNKSGDVLTSQIFKLQGSILISGPLEKSTKAENGLPYSSRRLLGVKLHCLIMLCACPHFLSLSLSIFKKERTK